MTQTPLSPAAPAPLLRPGSTSGARPTPDPRRGAAGLRVGDAERQQVCDQLSRHFEQGRLDPVELEDRLEAAVAARTVADLHRLTQDLPHPTAPPSAAWVPGPVRPRHPANALLTALAWLTALTTTTVCLLMVLGGGVLLGGPAWSLAALLGGTLAATGGVAIGHLLHVHLGADRRSPGPAGGSSGRD